MKTFLPVLLCFLLSGCSSLFFYPATGTLATPDRIGIDYESLGIKARDGGTLHAWLMKADKNRRGVVVFFHGNAENITSHSFGVAFLCARGFDVLSVDYRGYGESSGEPSFDNMAQDIRTAIDYALDHYEKPVFVLGQSLGASMTAVALADYPRQSELAGVVFDSGFAKMRRIAREKVASVWFLYPLQYPLSWLVAERSPVDAVQKITVPKLFVAAQTDAVVDVQHSRDLYAAAKEPKSAVFTDHGAHIGALHTIEGRCALDKFLQENEKRQTNQRLEK